MPSVDLEGLIEDTRQEVADGGFTVMALVGDELGCDWAYTVGLHHNAGHPELLVVGLEAKLGGIVLELLGRRVLDGERLVEGGVVELDGGLSFVARAVDPLFSSCGDWFVLGREVMSRWGRRWPASLQLVWTDVHAEHDGDPSTPSLRQPLLFSA